MLFVSTAPFLQLGNLRAGDVALREVIQTGNGYARSKMIAEQLLLRMKAMPNYPGHRLSILKPGYIIGNTVSGVANVDDFIWRVVAGCISLGVFPQSHRGSMVFISSSDNLAAAAIKSLHTNDQTSLMRASASAMPIASFWEAVCAAVPKPLRSIAFSEWRLLATATFGADQQHHPIVPVLHVIQTLDASDELIGICSEAQCLESSAVTTRDLEAAVIANVKYLQRIGYFSIARREERPTGVFTRGRYKC